MRSVILDFDGTLAYFREGGALGWFSILTNRGFPEDVVQKTYQDLLSSKGFSIDRFLEMIRLKTALRIDEDGIKREFNEWVKQQLTLYPDALPAIKRWRIQGVLVVVLSAGEASFQQQKVQSVNVPYDELIIVDHAFEKASKVRDLIASKGNSVVIIDNRVDVLDDVYEQIGKEVITVWIRRPGSKKNIKRSRYSHVEVKSLFDSRLDQFVLNT